MHNFFAKSNALVKHWKLLNKNLSFKSTLLIPTVSTSAFHSTKLVFFLVTIFLEIALLHFLHRNAHKTYNSSSRSNEGLALETSAFQLFTVANLRYQLTLPLKINE